MPKLQLNDLANLNNPASVVSTINANNAATEAALELTLSRNDTVPNQMESVLDMNSNRIVNLGEPLVSSDAVRLIDLDQTTATGISPLTMKRDGTTTMTGNLRFEPGFTAELVKDGVGNEAVRASQLFIANSLLTYCAGDGVTDDTAGWESARIAADLMGLPLDGQGRKYLISGTGVVLPKAGILRATVLISGVNTGKAVPGIGTVVVGAYLLGGDMWGGSWPTATITGVISKATPSFVVSNGSLFAPGQRVLVHENTAWGNAKANSSETVTAVSAAQTVFTMATVFTTAQGQMIVQVETGVGTGVYGTPLVGGTAFTVTNGSATLTLTTGVAIGRRVLITRQFGRDFARRSEAAIVKSVVGNTVKLCHTLRGVYGTGAGATLRPFPDVNPVIDDFHIVDAEDTDVNFGLLVMNCNEVTTGSVSCKGVYRTALSIYGCGLLRSDMFSIDGATQRGLGYGLLLSGTDTSIINQIWGTRCRHLVTSGGGPEGVAGGQPLNRLINIGLLAGSDLSDAIFDAHPGVCDLQIGVVHGVFDNTAEDAFTGTVNDGDAFLWQGGGSIKVGVMTLTGFRRTGLALQSYGNGDQEIVSYHFGSVTARSNSTAVASYGIAIDDQFAYQNGYDFDCLSFNHIDVETANGTLVTMRRNTMNRLSVLSGRSAATAANGTGFLIQNFSSAAPYPQPTWAGKVLQFQAGNVWFQVPNTPTGTGRPLFIQGTSGFIVDRALLSGCTFSGGVQAARGDHCVVRLVDPTYANSASNAFSTGTGGSFLTATFA